MGSTFEKRFIETYNKKAMERELNELQKWKMKERETFLKYLQNENYKSLLEIGAGTGKDSLYFNEQGLDTFSIDLSPEMIKLRKEKGLNAEVMSFYDLDFPEAHFDSIYALNCLLHVPKAHIKEVLKGIKKGLKTFGIILLWSLRRSKFRRNLGR